MRYKDGDKVRVRGDLEVGKNYESVPFLKRMECFKNKTAEITKSEDYYYGLSIDNICYAWVSEMLRPAEFKIWCETKEEKQAVLEELEKEGYVWWDDCSKPTKNVGKNGKCGLHISESRLSISYDDDYYIKDRRVELTPSEFTGIDFVEKIIITKTTTGTTATYGNKTVTTGGDFKDAARQALAEVLCPFKVGDMVCERIVYKAGIVKGIENTGRVIVDFGNCTMRGYDYIEYHELEPYTEPPYNAKLFCIKGSSTFTQGKIYEVKDNEINGDDGAKIYPFKDLEEVNGKLDAKFMEVLDD